MISYVRPVRSAFHPNRIFTSRCIAQTTFKAQVCDSKLPRQWSARLATTQRRENARHRARFEILLRGATTRQNLADVASYLFAVKFIAVEYTEKKRRISEYRSNVTSRPRIRAPSYFGARHFNHLSVEVVHLPIFPNKTRELVSLRGDEHFARNVVVREAGRSGNGKVCKVTRIAGCIQCVYKLLPTARVWNSGRRKK